MKPLLNSKLNSCLTKNSPNLKFDTLSLVEANDCRKTVLHNSVKKPHFEQYLFYLS